MGFGNFVKNVFGAYGKKTAEGSINLFTELDPNTASDVQIRQYGDEVTRRAELVVSAQNRVNDLTSKVDNATNHVQQLKDAISNLASKDKSPENDEAISKGLDEAERYKKDAENYSKDLEVAKNNLETYKTNHEAAVKRWTEAKENFAKLQEQNERLKEDLNSAKERNEDAKKSAGLDNSIDTSTMISTAMESRNKKLQSQIDTLSVTSDALGKSNSSNDILEKAIQETNTNATLSVEDRLKNL